MSVGALLDLLLVVAAGLGMVWVLLPTLMMMARLGRFRVEIDEDPSHAEPSANDPNYQVRFSQFLSLGFRPIGLTFVHGWFTDPFRWRWRSLQGCRWLASPDGKTMIMLFRIVPQEPVRFGAASLLEGGGAVRTICPGMYIGRTAAPRYLRVEVRHIEPAELVTYHQKNVDEFCREGGFAVKGATLRDTAVDDPAQPSLISTRRMVLGFCAILVMSFAVPYLGFLLTWLIRERVHALHDLAVALCAGIATFAVVRHYVLTKRVVKMALKSHEEPDVGVR